jgi:hypothetical protein
MRIRFGYFGLILSIVLGLATFASAGEKAKQVSKSWYQWSTKGTPAGYFYLEKEVDKSAAEPVKLKIKFMLKWKGKRLSLEMAIGCLNDEVLSPLSIESSGKGDDEFQTFKAKISWDGKIGLLKAKIRDKKIEKQLPERTTTDMAVFDLVRRLPFDKQATFSFNSLEASELNLKKNHQLKYLGKEELEIGGSKQKLHHFEQTGGGISPCQYWVNDRHELVRVLMDRRKEFLLTDQATAEKVLSK